MIHLNRPNESPQVLLTRGRASTQLDCAAYAEHPDAYRSGERKFMFASNIYGSTEIRTMLRTLQHNKCCYCESKTSPGRIDHFRPKGAVRQCKGSDRIYPGYYWLAYRWDNLLFACEDCNLKKSDCFPLADPEQRALSHCVPPERESPLLLNPYADAEPGEHITFDGSACRPRTARGRETVTLLELNRPILQDDRQSVLNTLSVLCDVARHPGVRGTLRQRARAQTTAYTRPDARHSAMACEYVSAINADV